MKSLHVILPLIFILGLIFNSNLFAQQVVHQINNPQFSQVAPNYSIEKISYTSNEIIFSISIKIKQEGIITLNGPMISDSWFLVSQAKKKTFRLLSLRKIKRDNKLENSILKKGESVILTCFAGEVYRCDAHFELVDNNIDKVIMIAGMIVKANNVLFRNIAVNRNFGKEAKNEVVTDNTEQNTQQDDIDEYQALIDKYKKNLTAAENNSLEKAQIYENLGNTYLSWQKYSQAVDNYLNARKIQQDKNNKKEIANINLNLGNAYFYQGDNKAAINTYKNALNYESKNNETAKIAILQNNIASAYENSTRFGSALEFYDQAATNKLTIKDEKGAARIHYKMGNIYFVQEQYDDALVFFTKSLSTDEKLGNQTEITASLNNIGVVYYEKNDLDKALQSMNRSLDLAEKGNNSPEIARLYNNIGNVNYDKKNYTRAIEFYGKALKLKESTGDKLGVALTLHNIGNAHYKKQELTQALNNLKKSIEIATEINNKAIQFKNYKSIAQIVADTTNCNPALSHYKKYIDTRFSLSDEREKQISEMNIKYVVADKEINTHLITEIVSLNRQHETKTKELHNIIGNLRTQKLLAVYQAQQKQKEALLLKKENQLQSLQLKQEEEKAQKRLIVLYGLIAVIVLVAIFFAVLLKQFRDKKKKNIQLAFQNSEIKQQKEEIESQRDEIETQRDFVIEQRDHISDQKQHITDSIEYASLIQKAILPPEKVITSLLPEYFILYKPRDIVSGDFYWVAKKNNKSVVVVADCTGHGVPGAFMSMLGVSLLNEIVRTMDVIESDLILNQLRSDLIKSLHQTGKDEEAKDGIDLSLCIIDKKNGTVEFSGAYNPMYLISGDELSQYKADKMPIGISRRQEQAFQKNIINIKKSDVIYLFSDGYVDQFGGTNDKKFLTKRFKKLLLEIKHKPMSEQKEILDKTLEDWKGTTDQIDDILVMGIRL